MSSEGDPATEPAAAATAGGWVDVGIEPVTTGLVEDSSELSSIELPKDERSGDKAALAPATPSAAIAKAAYCTKNKIGIKVKENFCKYSIRTDNLHYTTVTAAKIISRYYHVQW